MKKINKLIYTKKNFQNYHVRLWDGIIKEVQRCQSIGDPLAYIGIIKENVVKYLFGERINNKLWEHYNCFGCLWGSIKNNSRSCKRSCLFSINDRFYKNICSDYYIALENLTRKSKNYIEVINICIRIRDFPIREV